jgi:cell division septum initiation protein DivIVA
METTETFSTTNSDQQKRIDQLESQVRNLTEQVHKMAAALTLNSRQLRRQNTDIHNVTTVLRNHK